MTKNDLVSVSIWDGYSNEVINRMNNPFYQGKITKEKAKKLKAKLIIVDFNEESFDNEVRLYWAINEINHKILEAKFKAFGSGIFIAYLDVMVQLCIGKTIDEALKIKHIDVEKALRDEPNIPVVPSQKMHYFVVLQDIIKKAVTHYKGVHMDFFEQKEMMVCECARVFLGTIKEVIKLNDLKSVEEITNYTKAGAFCKSCVKPGGLEEKDLYLVDILEKGKKMEKEKLKDVVDISEKKELTFDKMTLAQRIETIDLVLDEDIRPMLAMDGGNMEVIDIKENLPHYDLYIRYLGACSGCSAGSTGTLYAIESVLQQKIDEKLRILPI